MSKINCIPPSECGDPNSSLTIDVLIIRYKLYIALSSTGWGLKNSFFFFLENKYNSLSTTHGGEWKKYLMCPSSPLISSRLSNNLVLIQ